MSSRREREINEFSSADESDGEDYSESEEITEPDYKKDETTESLEIEEEGEEEERYEYSDEGEEEEWVKSNATHPMNKIFSGFVSPFKEFHV